jgi:hypothetical protein
MHEFDGGSEEFLGSDLEVGASKLFKEMEKILTPRQYQAFEMLFIKNISFSEN